jgi:hypothetical protein
MRTIFYVHHKYNFRCPFSEMLSKLVVKMYQKREGLIGLVVFLLRFSNETNGINIRI